MQTLRFDTAWLGGISPITLRFGDDTPPPVVDGIGIEWVAQWRGLVPASGDELQLVADSQRRDNAMAICWQSGHERHGQITSAWALPAAIDYQSLQPWQSTQLHQHYWTATWQLPRGLEISTEWRWRHGPALQQHTMVYWATLGRHGQQTSVGWNDAPYCQQSITLAYQYQQQRAAEPAIAWGPHLGRWVCSDAYEPPAVGVVTIRFDEPFASSTNPLLLRFEHLPMVCVWVPPSRGQVDANHPVLPPIDFKTPIEPQIRRLYLMQPVLTCHRVSDNTALVIKSVSINDARSQFVSTASIEFSSKGDAILARNQLLRITINGYDFYVIAEQPSQREAWNSGSYSSSGRGKAAALLTPWRLPVSYSNATARSFAGVLGDLLDSTGWSINLQGVTDFTIPAGIATISDKTPLEAVAEFAAMVGCMLAPNDETNVINVLPLWPTVPWLMDSATPDVIIHDAVILDYSSNETINQLCNAVWLRGEQQGISAMVKRDGTAGDVAAADIANPLILDTQSARMAGTPALADTGNKQQVSVTLPVMADLPPMKKGQLVGVTWRADVFRALCDSVTITASVNDNGAVTVRQQVALLRPME